MISACTLDCPDACSLLITPGELGLQVRGNPDHPFTQGYVCSKVKRYLQRLNSPERILGPRLKHKGKWQQISWDQALEICAQQLESACRQDPARILHISGQGARGVSKMLVSSFFAALGSSRLQGSLCDGTGIQASLLDFGGLEQNPLQDLLHSKWIINWGRDVRRSSIHTHGLLQQARQQNTRVISIWPGGNGYQGFSDDLIRIAPGQDRYLALAVLKVIWEQGSISSQAVQRTRNWPQVRDLLHAFSLQELCQACQVAKQEVYYLAAAYSQHQVSTLIGWGVQRHPLGGENVRMIDALAWLSGNVGAAGAGVYYNIASARNFDLSWLPDHTSRYLNWPTLAQDLQEATAPPLSLAWINATNPANQVPDSKGMARALSKLDLLIVVDGFWTDTACCADLVLPCTLMGEEEDLLGSCMHDFVHYAREVQAPPAGVRSDLWIVQELNQRLNLGLDIMDRKACLQRSLACQDPDQALRQLEQKGYFLSREQKPVYEQGTHHQDGLFRAISKISPEPETESEYPFRLLSLIRKEAVHSQMLTTEQTLPPTVWVNPQAPGLQGLDLQGEVLLVSRLGRIQVQVEFDSSLHPAALIYRRGDWMRLGGGVNQLIQASLSDLSIGAAQYKQQVALRNPV
ncbi:MAG: molybdopterin-dependent oxidoreductase [Desulfohalobiaceae bacterium]